MSLEKRLTRPDRAQKRLEGYKQSMKEAEKIQIEHKRFLKTLYRARNELKRMKTEHRRGWKSTTRGLKDQNRAKDLDKS